MNSASPTIAHRNARRLLGRTHLLTAIAILVAISIPSGCSDSKQKTANTSSSGKPKVVATTGMIADLVKQIGGEQIELTQLINAGVDPHLYRPTRDDVSQIRSADIVFYNGLKLEGRMSDLLGKQSSPNQQVIAVGDTIPEKDVLGDLEHETADPHVWMDVSLWSLTTQRIEKELSTRLPDHADEFKKRATEIQTKLASLDAQGKAWIETIPESKRVLITSHDAFRYFGRRYGLRVEGIQGISTASEAGLKRINELVDLIVENKVPAAFVESSVPQNAIKALIEAATSRGSPVSIGGELYSDAMGPTGSGADSYEGMLRHNFKTVTKALGGKVDE